jgi:hypothetical protein
MSFQSNAQFSEKHSLRSVQTQRLFIAADAGSCWPLTPITYAEKFRNGAILKAADKARDKSKRCDLKQKFYNKTKLVWPP